MSSAFEQVFWRAVDDINAGRIEPVEQYLALVPSDQRDELAALLADVLVTRGPTASPTPATSEGYSRALAAIDEISGSSGPTGVLPGALRAMRHSRGIERDRVVETLAHEFSIESSEGRKSLERFYHRLESGKLLGSRLAHRLLSSLARIFDVDVEDFVAGAQPTGPLARPRPIQAMGRSGSPNPAVRPAAQPQSLSASDDERLVERLFTGGPDA